MYVGLLESRRTDEEDVDDLEQPRRDLGAEDGPAVVLLIASKGKCQLEQNDDEPAEKRTHSRKSPRLQVL
jgi:hypothetical protein